MTMAGKARTLEIRRIGSLEVSAVGLGCNNFGPCESPTRIDWSALVKPPNQKNPREFRAIQRR